MGADLAAELKKTKAELTAEKDAAAASLSDKKATFESATGDFNARKAGVIGLESANAAGKGDDLAKLDKVGTALLRDKKEMLAAIGSAEKMVWTHGRLATLLRWNRFTRTNNSISTAMEIRAKNKTKRNKR